MQFKSLTDKFLSKGCDEFVTLYTSSKKPWEHQNNRESSLAYYKKVLSRAWRAEEEKRYGRAQENQQRWLDEVRKNGSSDFDYLMIIENRSGDSMFHVLLRGCDWEDGDFENYWAHKWHEISGGKAFKNELNESIGGLIRHFVVDKHLLLEFDGDRYLKDDFDEWRSY